MDAVAALACRTKGPLTFTPQRFLTITHAFHAAPAKPLRSFFDHPHSLAGLDRRIQMSVSLTFPDGSVRAFDAGTTGFAVAESISKSLAKKAVAIALDGELRDLSDPVTDGRIEIVTPPIRARSN